MCVSSVISRPSSWDLCPHGFQRISTPHEVRVRAWERESVRASLNLFPLNLWTKSHDHFTVSLASNCFAHGLALRKKKEREFKSPTSYQAYHARTQRRTAPWWSCPRGRSHGRVKQVSQNDFWPRPGNLSEQMSEQMSEHSNEITLASIVNEPRLNPKSRFGVFRD